MTIPILIWSSARRFLYLFGARCDDSYTYLELGATIPILTWSSVQCPNRLPHTIAQKGLQNVDVAYWNRTLFAAEHVHGILLLLLCRCRRYVGANGRLYDRTTSFISIRDRAQGFRPAGWVAWSSALILDSVPVQTRMPKSVTPRDRPKKGFQDVDFTYWNRTLLGAEHVPGILLLLLYYCRRCVGANDS